MDHSCGPLTHVPCTAHQGIRKDAPAAAGLQLLQRPQHHAALMLLPGATVSSVWSWCPPSPILLPHLCGRGSGQHRGILLCQSWRGDCCRMSFGRLLLVRLPCLTNATGLAALPPQRSVLVLLARWRGPTPAAGAGSGGWHWGRRSAPDCRICLQAWPMLRRYAEAGTQHFAKVSNDSPPSVEMLNTLAWPHLVTM